MEISELQGEFMSAQPSGWEDLPDLDLYMDQLVTYMERQHIGLRLGEQITPSMINNYIKVGLMPRADGKRYKKEHIAYLTVICLLKQVISVSDAAALLCAEAESSETRDFYELFRSETEAAFRDTAAEFLARRDGEDTRGVLLRLAVRSYAQKLACEQLLKLGQTAAGEKGKKARKS